MPNAWQEHDKDVYERLGVAGRADKAGAKPFHGNGWEVAWRNHPPIELVCFGLSIAVILLLLHFIKYNNKLFGGSISLLMKDRWSQ